MPKKIDLNGKRFGNLTVIKEDGRMKYGTCSRIAWKCMCDCGNIVRVAGSALTSGNTNSCGCRVKEQALSKIKDLTNQRFGRLVVTGLAPEKRGNRVSWSCICDCGKTIIATGTNLSMGKTTSCGCKKAEDLHKRSVKHGDSNTRLYKIWIGMHERCNNRNHISYKYYGERGIQVCHEWDDYLEFRKWSLANGYDALAERGVCTIDRINVNGNYEPLNCRWTSMKEQNKNRRCQ